MDISSGIQASLAGRYATALFDLAKDGNQQDAVESTLDGLESALGESAEFKALIASPQVSRGDAGNAVAAIAKAVKADALTGNFLGVLAQNGRLAALPSIISAYRVLAAHHRGEVKAEVISAHPLTKDQLAKLTAQLAARTGSNISVDAQVDPSILGGLVVRMGSQMIDSSIKTRLNTLAQAMKG